MSCAPVSADVELAGGVGQGGVGESEREMEICL